MSENDVVVSSLRNECFLGEVLLEDLGRVGGIEILTTWFVLVPERMQPMAEKSKRKKKRIIYFFDLILIPKYKKKKFKA